MQNPYLQLMASLALWAYRMPGEPEQFWVDRLNGNLATLRLSLYDVYDAADTQAYVATADNSDDIYVVFRGTEPLRGRDVGSGLQAWPRQDRFGRTHSGYSIALDRVWDRIAQDLEHLRSADTQVHFCGHSMGGSLATIAASRMLKTWDIGGLVTFGAPPAVSRFLAMMLTVLLNGKCHRVESADLVTLLLHLLYRPAGNLHYLPTVGRLIERAGWYVAVADRVRVLVRSLVDRVLQLCRGRWRAAVHMPDMINNHSMIRYHRALNPQGAES